MMMNDDTQKYAEQVHARGKFLCGTLVEVPR